MRILREMQVGKHVTRDDKVHLTNKHAQACKSVFPSYCSKKV